MTNHRSLKRKGPDASSAGLVQSSHTVSAAAAAAPRRSESDDTTEGDSGSADERGRTSLTCALCKKLLFDPVTAPTGNSFCRYCLQRALAEKPVCPVTQKVIHMNARRFPVRIRPPARLSAAANSSTTPWLYHPCCAANSLLGVRCSGLPSSGLRESPEHTEQAA
jgi:hypothetical protein